MALPVVAIIGRPNVGKSSLFNALAGRMISIVEPTPGVTRDRVSAIIEKNNCYFELVDTGGYGIVDADHLENHVHQQIQRAIESANLVLFVVDIRDGIMSLDQTITRLLRKHNLKVLGVANKADAESKFPEAGEFGKLGFGEFLCVSAKNNVNKDVLLDTIIDRLKIVESARPAEPVMKIAIVGKRNAGKSSIVNAIVGDDRVIVSETPGTTRDAVDIRFEKDGQTIVVIDTPGVKKKSKLADNIEFYSFVRATSSVRRADVVLLMIDATTPVSQPDKKLAQLIAEENKACIIVVNKWDLAKDSADTGQYEDYLTKLLPGLRHAPIAFTTANKGQKRQKRSRPGCRAFQAGDDVDIDAETEQGVRDYKGNAGRLLENRQAENLLRHAGRNQSRHDSYVRQQAGTFRRELSPIRRWPTKRFIAHSRSADSAVCPGTQGNRTDAGTRQKTQGQGQTSPIT